MHAYFKYLLFLLTFYLLNLLKKETNYKEKHIVEIDNFSQIIIMYITK